MEEYLEQARELDLVLYHPCNEYDLALFNWWVRLQEAGEFNDLFDESQRPLSKFFKIFKPPCVLALAFDGTNIWMAVWFTPAGDNASSAFVSYWCEKDKRGSRKQLKITKLLYTMAFKFWKVLVGVTKHENLLRIHRRLGYNIVGTIPFFMEGEDAWVVYLTEDNFKDSRVYKLGES